MHLLLTFLNIWTLVSSKYLQLRCYGDERSETILTTNISFDDLVIYFKTTDKTINITCLFFNEDGKNSSEANGLYWTDLTNNGHKLILAIKNSTWAREIQFPLSDGGVWKLSLALEQLALSDSGTSDSPLTDWLFTVHYDLGLYKVNGCFVLLSQQMVLNLPLGSAVTDVQEVLSKNILEIKGKRSPCSEYVWLISPVIQSSIYLAVSYTAFQHENWKWYRLTELLLEACSWSGSSCPGGIMLRDFIYTNSHIILITNIGYFTSENLSQHHGSTAHGPVMVWSKVNPFKRTSYHEEPTYLSSLFHYSPVCLGVQMSCILQDKVDITYSRNEDETTLCTGSGNFQDDDWSCSTLNKDLNVGHIRQIAFTSHTGSAVLLHWSEGRVQAAVTVTHPALDKSHFPTFFLPKGIVFSRIMLHPYSMHIFLLGDELWASHDLGATFSKIYKPETGQVIDVIFSADGSYSQVIAVSSNGSGYNIIAYGTLAARRLRTVALLTSPMLLHPVANRIKLLEVLTYQKGMFRRSLINNVSEKLKEKIYLNSSLAIQFYSDNEITALELSEGKSAAFEKLHTGLILKHKSGGTANVADVNSHGSGIIQIKLMNSKSFLNAIITTPELSKRYLQVYPITTHESYITQMDELLRPLHVWRQIDVGKTVLSLDSYHLITKYVNSTAVIAKATSSSHHQIIKPKEWMLIDFSADTWWLEENECKEDIQIETENSQQIITLDQGSFTTMHIQAHRALTQPIHNLDLEYYYSNPFLFKKIQSQSSRPGYSSIALTLTDRYFKRSMSSFMVSYPYNSLRCDKVAVVYTILLCCPNQKRMVFNYPNSLYHKAPLVTETGSKQEVMKTLPVNYRPPSSDGIAIPTSGNVYNADPHQPMYKSKYKASKNSAVFKFPAECYNHYNKSNNTCGCHDRTMENSLITVSDCITQVYRVDLPGQFYLCFAFELLNSTTSRFFRQPVQGHYTIALSETNNRSDFFVENDEDGKTVKLLNQDLLAKTGVLYNSNPSNLRLTLYGSGLYHFKSSVPKNLSYCRLEAEFMVYVDQAPIPYPVHFMINFGVTIGMGFVMFLVYVAYRVNERYAEDVFKICKEPMCHHTMKNSTNHLSIFPEDSEPIDVGRLIRSRKSQIIKNSIE